MNTTQIKAGSAKVRKIEVEIPGRFLEVAEHIASIEEVSVNALIIKALVSQIAFEMQEPLGAALHRGDDNSDYAKQLEALAWPERAQEVEA